MKQGVTNRVQELRKERGFTQAELAEAVFVTRQTIISIEKGNYLPSISLALNLAKTFETKVEEVFLLTN